MGYPIKHIVGFDGETYDLGGGGGDGAKSLWLKYDTSTDEWKVLTYDYSEEVLFDDIHVGDIITIIPYNVNLPANFCFIGSLKDYNDSIYLQYVGELETSGIVMKDGSDGNPIEVLTITPNYAFRKGIDSQEQTYSSANIRADSTVDEISEVLRSFKNVVDINYSYTDPHYVLFGYGPNGVIPNLNQIVCRIMYDDGSFAMIYYPEAGTIPDGITPGFTEGLTSTPPVGNWQPFVVYDSVFYFQGNDNKCSITLEYNGQGFYGTPASGTGLLFTENTSYFIVLGHINDKYMALEA